MAIDILLKDVFLESLCQVNLIVTKYEIFQESIGKVKQVKDERK